ncbi:condensation domain-containing protein [Bradyrhizobium pachyrhizi]|uniref:condensation domain-containing protein n=1 Tax=Bradyrhizobium pachyrhizi TaxID=280333 RepID=UPI000A7F11FB|nr:condensation domain-containing protein [Bradyrhizobium pachyrhizi]
MDIKEFVDLDRRPGRLMVWRVNVPEPISWRADPRRPSYVQEEHLRSADDGRRGWLGAAFELPGEFNAAALTKAILGWVDRHEVLRSRLAKDGSAIHRATIHPGAVTLEKTVAGACTDGGEIAQLLEKLFDVETNPLRWPAYVFVTISRPTSTSLLLASDHSVSDAYSMALVPYELRELYTAAIHRVEPQLAAVHSYLDHAEAERERLTDLTDDHPAIGHWRELIAANGGQLPDFPLPFDAPKGSLQRSGQMWLLDAAGASEFDHGCRSQGGNAVTGIFACLALAGKKLADQRQFHAVAPFHTRYDLRSMRSVGWYVGMSPVSFRVADTLPEILHAARLELKRAKKTAQVPFSKAMELLGTTLRDRFMVSYMDNRTVPGSDCWPHWRTRFLISRSSDASETYLWVSRWQDGICVNFRHPGTATARSAMDDYLAEVVAQAHLISGARSLPQLSID